VLPRRVSDLIARTRERERKTNKAQKQQDANADSILSTGGEPNSRAGKQQQRTTQPEIPASHADTG